MIRRPCSRTERIAWGESGTTSQFGRKPVGSGPYWVVLELASPVLACEVGVPAEVPGSSQNAGPVVSGKHWFGCSGAVQPHSEGGKVQPPLGIPPLGHWPKTTRARNKQANAPKHDA